MYCMYLCIYFYNICTMICDVQVTGAKKKTKPMDATGIPTYLCRRDSIMLTFAAFKISPLHKV